MVPLGIICPAQRGLANPIGSDFDSGFPELFISRSNPMARIHDLGVGQMLSSRHSCLLGFHGGRPSHPGQRVEQGASFDAEGAAHRRLGGASIQRRDHRAMLLGVDHRHRGRRGGVPPQALPVHAPVSDDHYRSIRRLFVACQE